MNGLIMILINMATINGRQSDNVLQEELIKSFTKAHIPS